MDDTELNKWAEKNNISQQALNIIKQVRDNEPFRRVQGGKSNVAGRYPSRKMRCIIQFESKSIEYPFAVLFENDEQVLAFYDQPVPVKMDYYNIKGRHVVVLVTPDYFTIMLDGTAGWIECKPEEELVRLSKEAPERYYKDGNGCWRSLPGEQYAEQFGLFFKIKSSAEIDWTFIRNLIFLQDYQREEPQEVSETQAHIIATVESNQGILLLDLLLGQDESIANDLYRLILNGVIYVDLNRYPLGEPSRVPVFSSEQHSIALAEPGKSVMFQSMPSWISIEPGTRITWAGSQFTIVTVGEGFVWCQNEHDNLIKLTMCDIESMVESGEVTGIPITSMGKNPVLELLKGKSKEDHKRAMNRRASIAGFLSGKEKRRPTSTEYYWLKMYREAEKLLGSGLFGLYDKNRSKGNRKPRLHEESYRLMDFCIETEYLVLEQVNVRTAYGQYIEACNKAGLYKVSYDTFRKRSKAVDAELKARERKGKRSAYQLKPFYMELSLTTPRHGDRPFEIAHIDHTQLDIELINTRTLENLGRPWLTLMIDANSRRNLAFYLSFEPPSYRSCMNIVRICGLRHRCLPQIIVVDNGKEFKSTYFEMLLASYEITKKERPPAEPRYGSVLERLFGTNNTEFIHTLQGNTQIMKDVRQVTKSNNPKNRAIWNLGVLTDKLSEFLYEVYDSNNHTGIRESPRDAFNRGLFLFGKRRMISPTAIQGFIFSTLPTTDRGEATVIQSSGVKINNIYYRNEALNTPGIIGTKVQVKYDPFNLGHAYAYVGNAWIECISQYYAQFKDLTEKEYQIISAQLAAEYIQSNSKIPITSKRVAAFIGTAKETEKELIAQKQAEEQRGLLGFTGNFTQSVESKAKRTTLKDNIDWNSNDDADPDDENQKLD